MTARDGMAVDFLAQIYGAPLPFVQQLLGALSPNPERKKAPALSVKRTRKVVKRWVDVGLVRSMQVEMGGPVWVYPTPSTVNALLDFSPRAWSPTRTRATHTLAACEARFALVGADPDPDLWKCERELRYAAGPVAKGAPHVHDGWYRTTAGEWWAIEIELTSKRPVGSRLKTVVGRSIDAASKGHCEGLVYACETDRIADEVSAAVEFHTAGTGTRTQQLMAKTAGRERIPEVRVVPLSLLPKFFADVERRAVS